MIPRAHITAWRAHAPWATDAQVEQDLVISRALVEIFSDPFLARTLAFRGGTALHKLFFQPPARYSEDIDLVQVHAEPIGPALDALRTRLDPWLGKPQRKQGEGRVSLVYRFESEGLPATRMRLKVEINTREHFAVHGHHRHPVRVENPWFTSSAEVVTFALEELLGTKLRALYQRKKGRDLFDLARALQVHPTLDRMKVVACFDAYMKHGRTPCSRAEFEMNLAEKEADRGFLGDVQALLAVIPAGFVFARGPESDFDPALLFDRDTRTATREAYDAKAALALVRRELVHLLPGEPWRSGV
ncbi:MAG: nucleotidyl transferase AbiEii/AbiGii toxin family protein [Polyangiaceae bacterium]